MKAEHFHKKDQARRAMRMAEIKMSMNDMKESKDYLNQALKIVREMEKESGTNTPNGKRETQDTGSAY